MTADQATRLLELLDGYRELVKDLQHEGGVSGPPFTPEQEAELADLAGALRDCIVAADAEDDDEPGAFTAKTPAQLEELERWRAAKQAEVSMMVTQAEMDAGPDLDHNPFKPMEHHLTEEMKRRIAELDANPTAISVQLREAADEFDMLPSGHPVRKAVAREIKLDTGPDYSQMRFTPGNIERSRHSAATDEGLHAALKDFDHSELIVKEILESGNVFVVEEPVPAGTLPPDTLVYRKVER